MSLFDTGSLGLFGASGMTLPNVGGVGALGDALTGNSPPPPQAPDFIGAVNAQAANQRYNQNTPLGSLSWNQIPGTDRWQTDVSLNPWVQQGLESQLQTSAGMGQTAQNMLPQIQNQYSQPMDLSSVEDISNQAYNTLTSRLDPQWNQREQQTQTQLMNQGLRPGMEGYTNAMRDFNTGRNDAYQQANLAAIQTMPQTYNLAQQAYMQPLNTMNALRSGAQTTMPTFAGQNPSGDYLGAATAQGQFANNQYNQQMAQQNALTQGLFGLGGAAILSSDRRLKSEIKLVDIHPLGIGIYDYVINGHRERGVMADEVLEVMPEAVVERNGYLAVNYGML